VATPLQPAINSGDTWVLRAESRTGRRGWCTLRTGEAGSFANVPGLLPGRENVALRKAGRGKIIGLYLFCPRWGRGTASTTRGGASVLICFFYKED
jgi:hypothetical protein